MIVYSLKTLTALMLLSFGLSTVPLSTTTAAEATVSKADTAAVMQPVQKLVAAINSALPKIPVDVFTNDAIVIDDFAPYHWSGKSNAAQWYTELVGTTPKARADFAAMKGRVALGQPNFTRITKDSAYLVIPSSFDFTDAGAHMHQTSEWVFNVVKVNGKWLIAGNAWAMKTEKKLK